MAGLMTRQGASGEGLEVQKCIQLPLASCLLPLAYLRSEDA